MEKKSGISILRLLPIELLFASGIALIALLVNSWYFGEDFSLRQGLSWMVRYFSFGNAYFLLFALIIYALFLKEFYLRSAHVLEKVLIKRKSPTHEELKKLAACIWRPLFILLPLSVIAGPLSALLGTISYHGRLTQLDLLFLVIDTQLFGTSPFLILPQFLRSDWIVWTLWYAYVSLGLGLSITFALLYLRKRANLFRQAVIAFVLSIALAYPFFYMLPCQAPSNFFILNLRNYSFSGELAIMQNAYNASPLTLTIMNHITSSQIEPEKEDTVPVSCFPSMHTTWALFVMYFLAQIDKRSLFFSLLWGFLVLLGGLQFAQHYLIDYFFAIPIAIASIAGAGFLLRLEASWQPSFAKASKGKQKRPLEKGF